MWGRGPWGFGGPGPRRGGLFWHGGFGFGPPQFGWAFKAKRGDVRTAILTLLAEQPRNGYQIIQEISDRSGGAWRPSPGAVYPALQQLTDEGLVRVEESEGRRTYHLTDAGRAYVDDQLRTEGAPWEEAMKPPFHEDVHDLFHLAAQAGAALVQVAQAGSDNQINRAKQVLDETRRKLYQIMAEGDEGPDIDV
jgi:DNA-binding PadR family transcriptional regulator